MSGKTILGALLLSLFAAAQAADTAAQPAVIGEQKIQEPEAKIEKSGLPAMTEKSTPAQSKKAVPAKTAKLPLMKYGEPDPKSLGLGCASGED